jgi:hypothetical protein
MWRLVKGWLPRALGATSALMFAIWGSQGGAWKEGAGLFYVGLAAGVGSVLAELFLQRPSYMALAKMNERAQMKADAKSAALERSLRILLERLADYCGLEGHSDRFSVYYFHEDEFVMLARAARNPNFLKRGRGRYPATQGALAVAWEADHGQALVTVSSSKGPRAKSLARQGFSEDEIARMRMPSVTVAALRIEGEKRSVGVLAIETTTPHRLTQAHLDKANTSHLVTAIGELVAAAALLTPEGERVIERPAAREPVLWKSSKAPETATAATSTAR